MRKLVFAIAAFSVVLAAPNAWAIDPPVDAQTNQVIWMLRNVSGGSLAHGDAVVYQTRNNDTNVEIAYTPGQRNSLGLDVTTTTSADSNLFAGCVAPGSSCGDDELCRVVVLGPAICKWAGSTDNTNTRGAAVGTTTVAKNLGSGTEAGQLLSLSLSAEDTENNGLQDNEIRWVFVSPGLGGH